MKIILFLMLLTGFVSCGFHSVDNGSVAIVVDTFSKNVHDELATSGLTFKPFTSFNEVDATDIRVEVNNLQPKDKKGMKFEDVDLTVTVRLIREKVVELYKETKEINYIEENESYVLGYNKLEQIVNSATIKAFQEFTYQEFVDERSLLEKRIEEKIVNGVSKLMYGAYEIVDVDTKTINLMPEIEKSFQNRSLVAQKLSLVKSKEELMLKELEVKQKEMERLNQIANKVGVTIKELMDYQIQQERNEVLSDLTKSSGSNILLNVDKK